MSRRLSLYRLLPLFSVAIALAAPCAPAAAADPIKIGAIVSATGPGAVPRRPPGQDAARLCRQHQRGRRGRWTQTRAVHL